MTQEGGLEIAPSLRTLFRGLEIFFWILSVCLCLTGIGFIAYQLTALFLPYWWNAMTSGEKYRFPQYFYRVYGDETEALTYEHYGYLVSAVVVTSVSAYHLIPGHPWAAKPKPEKTD